MSHFYNDSDKVGRFNGSHTVEIVDTDQRIYGAEGSLVQNLSDH